MNIFILEWDPVTCAQWHCDKHVVKMPLETTQMLCSVHWRYDNAAPYLPVHQKHPCTLWAGQSIENYQWLWRLGMALCEEYSYRYGKVHGCQRVLQMVRSTPEGLTEREMTEPAQAMPDEYKRPDTIVAYRTYYINDKARFCKWKNRPIPPFMRETMSSLSGEEKSKVA